MTKFLDNLEKMLSEYNKLLMKQFRKIYCSDDYCQEDVDELEDNISDLKLDLLKRLERLKRNE